MGLADELNVSTEDEVHDDLEAELAQQRSEQLEKGKKEQIEIDEIYAKLLAAEEQIAFEKQKKKEIVVTFVDEDLGFFVAEVGNGDIVVVNVCRGSSAHLAGIEPNMILRCLQAGREIFTWDSHRSVCEILQNRALRPLTATFEVNSKNNQDLKPEVSPVKQAEIQV